MSFGLLFCLITGASRGIGQAVAVEIARKSKAGSVLLLLARTKSGLEETKKLVHEVASGVHVELAIIDLGKPDKSAYSKAINDALANIKKNASDFENAILIHNAASTQSIKALNMEDSEVLAKDIAMNFTSAVILNTQFFKIFSKDTTSKRTVVQVSSGASMFPIPNTSLYGAIKCARNHFFRTLAVEEPTIRVMNYDPGTVETEMLKQYMDDTSDGISAEQKQIAMESSGGILQPSDTAKVLIYHLETDFKSGDMLNFAKDPDIYKKMMENMKKMMAKMPEMMKMMENMPKMMTE